MKVLQTQQEQQIGQHDGPVKEVFVLDEMNMVVSGSWDRTLRVLARDSPSFASQDSGICNNQLQWPLSSCQRVP